MYLSPISSPFRQYRSVCSLRRNPTTSISHSYSSLYHYFMSNLQLMIKLTLLYYSINTTNIKKQGDFCLILLAIISFFSLNLLDFLLLGIIHTDAINKQTKLNLHRKAFLLTQSQRVRFSMYHLRYLLYIYIEVL